MEILKKAGGVLKLRVERSPGGTSEWRSETTSVMEETFESVVSVTSTQVQVGPGAKPNVNLLFRDDPDSSSGGGGGTETNVQHHREHHRLREEREERSTSSGLHERHVKREYSRQPQMTRAVSESGPEPPIDPREHVVPEWRSAEQRLNLTQEILATPQPRTSYEINVVHEKTSPAKESAADHRSDRTDGSGGRPMPAPRTRSEPSTPVLGLGRDTPTMEKSDIIFSTLIRDRNGLGFDVEEVPMRGTTSDALSIIVLPDR